MTSWRRFARNRLAVAGLVVFLLLVLSALLAPHLAPYDPNLQDWKIRLQPPSAEHPFGTDEFGRDLLSRALYGGRVSLVAGVVPVLIGASVGTLIGLVAGYMGGWWDQVLMRLLDVLLAFPMIFLALAIVGTLGPGLLNAMLAVAVVSLPGYARLVRGQVLALRERDFVVAAQAMGATHRRVLLRHLLPNILSPLLVQATLSVGSAILTTASLSFLGLGTQPPTSDWGEMLASGRQYLPEAWWLAVFPGLFVMLAVLSVNLVGDGLRDYFDPKAKNER
ncbi:nickel transporter permease [Symbiobacterium thermophilum]|uniref:Oligopeptide ABC transporter permease protein n=2 Tax=Symbiobacterium thermophilum TaxID=2734 RepID=Q67L07_SYMTH|nr:nickel transporter permease [Symbiobacterium thermophilum]BAD41639.1 oligopeptide ABC transporter permease protein [Symbiobacterium thermophilum IAM 14863]